MTTLRESPGGGAPEFVAGPDSEDATTDGLGEGGQDTAIHVAAGAGRTDEIDRLLKQGHDVNARDRQGLTPLHQASGSGYPAVVAALLKAGANVCGGFTADDADTPLHWAAGEGRADIVEQLIEAGAQTEAAGRQGYHPLHLAVLHGRTGAVKSLIDAQARVDATAYGANCDTPLHIAAALGFVNVAMKLLRAGADINAEDLYSNTLMMNAALHGHAKLVALLLGWRARVNAVNKSGYTALHLAVIEGHTAVSSFLLEWGADARARGDNDHTPLSLAVKKGHTAIVALLLEAGADARISDEYGPGQASRLKDALEALEALSELDDREREDLVAGNAGELLKKIELELPLKEAISSGDLVLVALLTKHGADVNGSGNSDAPLVRAVQRGDAVIVTLLLDAGAKTNIKVYGTPLLGDALRHRYEDGIFQSLLNHCPDIDVRDDEGNTLLHLAAKDGRLQAIRLLLARAVDVNAENDAGMTPLELAAYAGNPYASRAQDTAADKLACVRLLLDAGARFDNEHCKPLVNAITGWDDDVVRLLVARVPNPSLPPDLYINSEKLELLMDMGLDETTLVGRLPSLYGSDQIRSLGKQRRELLEKLLPLAVGAEKSGADDETLLHALCDEPAPSEDIKMVLQAGGSSMINRRNAERDTPLHRFLKARGRLHLAGLKLLLKAGADVTLADGSGRTALQILSDRKKIRGEARLLAPLVKCLKAAGCPAQAGPDQDNGEGADKENDS